MKEGKSLKAGIGSPWTVEVILLTTLKGKNMIVLFFWTPFLDIVITLKALTVSCFPQTYFSLISIDISAFHPTLQTLSNSMVYAHMSWERSFMASIVPKYIPFQVIPTSG